MSVFARLQDAIATTLNIDPAKVTESSSAENLTVWDSLGHVNLMMAIEQTFDIYLDVEDFPKLTSVEAILAHLDAQGVR
jgi:acyl carrier protein